MVHRDFSYLSSDLIVTITWSSRSGKCQYAHFTDNEVAAQVSQPTFSDGMVKKRELNLLSLCM